MTEPRCDFLCRSCFCSRRGNQKRERFGNQRGLFRSLEFQRVLRLHDHLSAIPGLDTRKNDAQPHADARGHRCKEANLVDTVIQAGRCVLGDNGDLHGERGNHGKRQVTVRDRAAERAFPRGAFYVDMDPLTIAGAGRKGVNPLLVDCHPIGNAKLSPDPFAQASKCKLTHASLPELRCVKNTVDVLTFGNWADLATSISLPTMAASLRLPAPLVLLSRHSERAGCLACRPAAARPPSGPDINSKSCFSLEICEGPKRSWTGSVVPKFAGGAVGPCCFATKKHRPARFWVSENFVYRAVGMKHERADQLRSAGEVQKSLARRTQPEVIGGISRMGIREEVYDSTKLAALF